ncbi:MAG: sulfate adenylyltransferase [Euryarchaeota archaeon]|nr:sulfate adenylyltransferase [Euryarchaeota archaeon]MDE1880948.1 sulfate adenylyltransferase [Euryarchaeota archaeon]MDE2046111.1 sulfate adenylyltransferase [Thermoplasmata archaeon]
MTPTSAHSVPRHGADRPSRDSVAISPLLFQEGVNLATGVYAPVPGFLTRNDHERVVKEGRLSNDKPWPLPVNFPLLEVGGPKAGWKAGDEILLGVVGDGASAVLKVEEIYRWDREACAEGVYRTRSREHPGVRRLDTLGEEMIGGKFELRASLTDPYASRSLAPEVVRAEFAKRKWKKVVGFQTRNAPHVGHEYLQRHALELTDGLFVHPLIGEKKSGDFKDEVIASAYDALVGNYFPTERVFFSYFRTFMRYAGPREALYHALVRRNYGCTHFIVGRDAAGVGNFYGPYDSWAIFSQYDDLGVTPLFYTNTFWCTKCMGISTEKTCPHPPSARLTFKGTEVRQKILRGERPPPEVMRPEVADAILRFPEPFVP